MMSASFAIMKLKVGKIRNSSEGPSSCPKKTGGEASDVHPFSRRLNCYKNSAVKGGND